jgi:hypothetical protein
MRPFFFLMKPHRRSIPNRIAQIQKALEKLTAGRTSSQRPSALHGFVG